MKFDIKRPCNDCPFRKDGIKLRKGRAEEIAHALRNDGSFSCHKHVDYSKPASKRNKSDEQFCAGSILVMENEGNLLANVLIRLARAYFGLDESQLRGHDEVFESFDAFIEGCELGTHDPGIQNSLQPIAAFLPNEGQGDQDDSTS